MEDNTSPRSSNTIIHSPPSAFSASQGQAFFRAPHADDPRRSTTINFADDSAGQRLGCEHCLTARNAERRQVDNSRRRARSSFELALERRRYNRIISAASMHRRKPTALELDTGSYQPVSTQIMIKRRRIIHPASIAASHWYARWLSSCPFADQRTAKHPRTQWLTARSKMACRKRKRQNTGL